MDMDETLVKTIAEREEEVERAVDEGGYVVSEEVEEIILRPADIQFVDVKEKPQVVPSGSAEPVEVSVSSCDVGALMSQDRVHCVSFRSSEDSETYYDSESE